MRYLISLIFLFAFLIVQSQDPQVKWWYDVHDSSFGNSAAADVDGDGLLEIAFSCYRNDSSIYVLNTEDGSLLWIHNTGGCNDVAPIIYDVDGDDSLEIILPSSCVPITFCFDGATGEIEWQTYLHGSDSPPTIGDIDHDGKPEILHGNFSGWVTCLEGEDGSVKWDFLVSPDCWIQTAPTLLDADGDGNLDFVVANWSFINDNKIWCYSANDTNLLWETDLPDDYIYHGCSFADIDQDEKPELIVGDYSGKLMVLNAEDGSEKWTYSFSSPFYIGAPTSIADLNNDSLFEIVFFDGWKLGVLDTGGTMLWNYTIPGYASAFRGTAISDINNDDTLDVVFGTSDGEVYAFSGASGTPIWTINLAQHHDSLEFDIDHAPIIADFDQNGTMDVFIVGGRTDYPAIETNYGRAYMLSGNHSGGPDWLMFRHDKNRSGCISLKKETNDTIQSPDNVLSIDSTFFSETGISDIISDEISNFRIFPNPASEYFFIENKLNYGGVITIQLYNINGRQVHQNTINFSVESSLIKIQLTEKLISGIYFCKLINDNTKMVKKLLINKKHDLIQ